MTMAISKAVEAGARAVICASTGNTSAVRRRLRRAGGDRLLTCCCPRARSPWASSRRAWSTARRRHRRRQLRRRPAPRARGGGFRRAGGGGQFHQPVPDRRPEDGGVRDHRRPRRRARRAFPAGGQRGQHFRVLEGLQGVSRAGPLDAAAAHGRLPGGRGRAAFPRPVVEQPETLASAIRIGNPASWKLATQAMQDSGGAVDIVTDEEILHAQRWLAANEGIFVEPASAAGVAGLLECAQRRAGRTRAGPLRAVPDDGVIVITVTGHGLKDPTRSSNGSRRSPRRSRPRARRSWRCSDLAVRDAPDGRMFSSHRGVCRPTDTPRVVRGCGTPPYPRPPPPSRAGGKTTAPQATRAHRPPSPRRRCARG